MVLRREAQKPRFLRQTHLKIYEKSKIYFKNHEKLRKDIGFPVVFLVRVTLGSLGWPMSLALDPRLGHMEDFLLHEAE